MIKFRKSKTSIIAYIAILTALCVITNYFYLPIGTYFAVSFVTAICFITGILLSPFIALCVGFFSDLICCFLKGYPPNLYILAGSALWGLIMGIIYKKLKLKPIWKIVIGGIISFIICSLLLNSYGLYTYTSSGIPFVKYMYTRIPVQFINLLANLFVTYLVINSIKTYE